VELTLGIVSLHYTNPAQTALVAILVVLRTDSNIFHVSDHFTYGYRVPGQKPEGCYAIRKVGHWLSDVIRVKQYVFMFYDGYDFYCR